MGFVLMLATLDLNCPVTLDDRYRFPPRQIAHQALIFNRAFRRHVELRQAIELHNWWYWQDVLNETDRLYHCWDWLHAAQQGEGRDEAYWLRSLVRLRELIGDDAYNAGVMPPSVPLWAFVPGSGMGK